MNLIAATITVYFIGLVNFQARTDGGRNVIVPLATGTRTMHGQILETHRADVVITEWPTGAARCKSILKGTWKDSSCIVQGLSRAQIELPASAASFDTTPRFDQVPNLKSAALCPGITGPSATHPIAATTTLTNGQLDACTNGHAWISRLTLTEATGDFGIDRNYVTLSDGAVVHIINAPPHPPASSQEKHFWWYYAMYNGAAGCVNVPDPPTAALACPDSVLRLAHAHGMPAASGAGCSNTDYP